MASNWAAVVKKIDKEDSGTKVVVVVFTNGKQEVVENYRFPPIRQSDFPDILRARLDDLSGDDEEKFTIREGPIDLTPRERTPEEADMDVYRFYLESYRKWLRVISFVPTAKDNKDYLDAKEWVETKFLPGYEVIFA